MTCGIYRIKNKHTGRCYIGQSQHIAARWKQHRNALRNGRHHNPWLQASWEKWGEDAFLFEVVEELALDCAVLAAAEERWISLAHADSAGAFNMDGMPGVPVGCLTKEAKERISSKLKGRKLSAETRAKMSAAKKAQVRGPEWVAKIAAANRGKTRTPEQRARMSKPRSLEARANMSAAKKGKPSNHKGKKHTPEARAKIAEAARARAAKKSTE
jgi:group I intron endonuclease